MKNQAWKWINRSILLVVFALLFVQCEMGETGAVPTGFEDELSMRGQGDNEVDVCACLNTNFVRQDLSITEETALAFMQEEEKLARDVYLAFAEQWEARIFSNIAKAEQRHMDVLLCLVKRYGLEDLVSESETGVFQSPAIQTLYDDFIEKGAVSLEEALLVGATIEDLDISDLKASLEDDEFDNDDFKAVFNELLRGSRNHMRAFNRNLKAQGINYAVEYISQEDFEEIISSGTERGGSICGTCAGQGSGKKGNGQGACNGQGKKGNGGQGNGTCNGQGPGQGQGGQGSKACNGQGKQGSGQRGQGTNAGNGQGQRNGSQGNGNGNQGNGNQGNGGGN